MKKRKYFQDVSRAFCIYGHFVTFHALGEVSHQLHHFIWHRFQVKRLSPVLQWLMKEVRKSKTICNTLKYCRIIKFLLNVKNAFSQISVIQGMKHGSIVKKPFTNHLASVLWGSSPSCCPTAPAGMSQMLKAEIDYNAWYSDERPEKKKIKLLSLLILHHNSFQWSYRCLQQ